MILGGCTATEEVAEEEPVEEIALEDIPEVTTQEEESTTETQPARVAVKETVQQPPPPPLPPPPAPAQAVASEPRAPETPPQNSPWVQGQIDWMNMSPEEKAAEREANIAAREAANENPAAQHARQSQAANNGQGEGANMCGIAPDATWYGQPC